MTHVITTVCTGQTANYGQTSANTTGWTESLPLRSISDRRHLKRVHSKGRKRSISGSNAAVMKKGQTLQRNEGFGTSPMLTSIRILLVSTRLPNLPKIVSGKLTEGFGVPAVKQGESPSSSSKLELLQVLDALLWRHQVLHLLHHAGLNPPKETKSFEHFCIFVRATSVLQIFVHLKKQQQLAYLCSHQPLSKYTTHKTDDKNTKRQHNSPVILYTTITSLINAGGIYHFVNDVF